MELNEIIRWGVSVGLRLVIGVAFLLLAYRVGTSAIHRFVPQVLRAQATHLPSGSSSANELDKRALTIEDLLTRLLRVTVLALLVALVLAVLDLWPILAGIIIIVVALLFATQDVVLDYVMGFLILVEGPYFKGDWITVGPPGGVEGTVDEIGLRRTLLRDSMGSAHAVSNGLIRLSSNVTRLFSVATVEVQVLQARELDRAIEAATRVTREMGEDPAWLDRMASDAPTDIWVTGLSIEGASLRLQQKVPTGTAQPVASELRRRLAKALVAASIGTGRWDTPLPISTETAGPASPEVGRPRRSRPC